MGLTAGGIDRVEAFVIADGVSADGSYVGESLGVIVSWRSEHFDKLHQVYVNGRFCGVTDDVVQGRMVLGYRSSWCSVIRIEVFAVDVVEALVDYSGELEPYRNGGRVKLSFARTMLLPHEGKFFVYSNGGDGEIDYDIPVSEALPLWGAWQDKAGFGLCRFGEGDFGWDGSAAVGFGRGVFGGGEFGFDADMIEWTSGELAVGVYSFAIKVIDRTGKLQSGASVVSDVVMVPAADAAEGLAVGSFDSDGNVLELEIV